MSEKVDDCVRSILVRELAHAKFIIADAKILALQGGLDHDVHELAAIIETVDSTIQSINGRCGR